MPRIAKPRIGIALPRDDGSLRPGRVTHYLDDLYLRAVVEAGAEAVLLPAGPRDASLVETLDGVIFPGGDDFPPDRPYEGATFRLAPTEQRAADAALVESARLHSVPVLGICYGMQLLAVEAGGVLYAHLPADLPGAGPHQLVPPETHAVELLAGSRTESWLGASGSIQVGSRHHQAVSDPGPGFIVSARSSDGVIEGIESERGLGWTAVGVQWHPEESAKELRLRFFSSFVAACRDG